MQKDMTPKDKKLNERDMMMAQFQESLEKLELTDSSKKNLLLNQYNQMVDTVFETDDIAGFADFKKNEIIKKGYSGLQKVFSEKKTKAVLWAFIAGIILTLIPTFFYIAALKSITPSFEFVPNVMATKKPAKFQIIKTQEELAKAKTADMSNKQNLKIGIAIGYDEHEGLFVESSRENAIYKDIPQEVTAIQNGEYVFSPNVLKSRKPTPMELIENQVQLEQAETIKGLESRKDLELGGMIARADKNNYFAIPKDMVGTNYTIEKFSDIIEKKQK